MTREEAITWCDRFNDAWANADSEDDFPDLKYSDTLDQLFYLAGQALRQQETVTNCNGLNKPLTLDELRKMDGEPVWWWNNSAKPVCTICVWDRFMNEPMFANYDWQSEDTLKLSKYKWLKKCGYKPYRQKPEEGTV